MKAQLHDLLTSTGLLILRVGIGGFLLTHGWAKVLMIYRGQWDLFADPIGLGNVLSLILVAFAEFVCAILVMIGLLTRFAALPIVIAMSVAVFVAHAADPWTMQTAAERFYAGVPGFPAAKQPAMMFLIPYLALVFTGAGRFSLDALIFRSWSSRGAADE